MRLFHGQRYNNEDKVIIGYKIYSCWCSSCWQRLLKRHPGRRKFASLEVHRNLFAIDDSRCFHGYSYSSGRQEAEDFWRPHSANPKHTKLGLGSTEIEVVPISGDTLLCLSGLLRFRLAVSARFCLLREFYWSEQFDRSCSLLFAAKRLQRAQMVAGISVQHEFFV